MSSDESSEEEEEYSVESILAESWDHERRCAIYLIKWENYDLYESSWETKDSFLEGSRQILKNWAKVKRKRENGEIPEFDVNLFEVERERWLATKPDDESSLPKTYDTLDSAPTAAAPSDDEAEETGSVERSPQPRGKRAREPGEQDAFSTTTNEKHKRRRLSSSSSAGLIDSGPYRPKPPSISNGNVAVPETAEAEADDHISIIDGPKRQAAPAPSARPTVLPKPAAPRPELLKPARVLPKFSKVAQDVRERNARAAADAQRVPEPGQGPALDESDVQHPVPVARATEQRQQPVQHPVPVGRAPEQRQEPPLMDGAVYLTDKLATLPEMLFDLIVRCRGKRWRIYMTHDAYDRVKKWDASLAQDYQTLRQKSIISLMQKSPLETAGLHLDATPRKFKRYVVLKLEDEAVLEADGNTGLEVQDIDRFTMD